MKRDSHIYYRSFEEALTSLEDDQKELSLRRAIARYSLDFKEPKLSGIEKTIWLLIKPQLDANNKRFINGTKPKKKKQNGSKPEANNKQTGSKPEANNNDNVNDNVNDNYLYTRYEIDDYKKDTKLVAALSTHLNLSEERLLEYFDNFKTPYVGRILSKDEYEDVKVHFARWIKKVIRVETPNDETPEEAYQRKLKESQKLG